MAMTEPRQDAKAACFAFLCQPHFDYVYVLPKAAKAMLASIPTPS
jgi:hypothetical protein